MYSNTEILYVARKIITVYNTLTSWPENRLDDDKWQTHPLFWNDTSNEANVLKKEDIWENNINKKYGNGFIIIYGLI